MDYAKRAAKPTQSGSRIPGWVWFFTGLVTGCFISFLVYLSDYLPKPQDEVTEKRPTPRIVRPDELVKELQLDFYEIFPNSEVPLVEEYVDENNKITLEKDHVYILQVGSFRRAEDADSLRARLLLLGMDAYVKPGEVRGEFWHRVLVGPITSSLDLNRTQDKLASEGIEAIPLKLEAN